MTTRAPCSIDCGSDNLMLNDKICIQQADPPWPARRIEISTAVLDDHAFLGGCPDCKASATGSIFRGDGRALK